MIGMERGIVRLVPYQADWPACFAAEAERLRQALGGRIGAVEHMGSTAIPGMPAKPIIDMAASVESLAEAEGLIPDLARLGYEWHERDRQDVPDRLYFVRRTADGRATTHHLSLAEPASDFWARHLAFRDYLRTHPEAAAEYAELKRDLARKFPTDRGAYVDGKEAFVKRICDLALGRQRERKADADERRSV